MTIRVEDLSGMDFSDVTDGDKLAPVHPGEILREEFLVPLNMSAHALALCLHVPAPRINDIVRERRSITADTALRLARYFGTTPQFWLGLQAEHDLRTSAATLAASLNTIQPLRPVA